MTVRTAIDKVVTFMGVYLCLTLLLPMGFYKIQPPLSYVGTLWGFLDVSAYISFIAGILLIFHYKIQTYLQRKAAIIIILSGIISTVIKFLIGSFLSPLTQTLIEGFHQIITHSGTITYLDVEIGGFFLYFSYFVGFSCFGLGVAKFFESHHEH